MVFRLKINNPDSPTIKLEVVEHRFSNGHILIYKSQNRSKDTLLEKYQDEEYIGGIHAKQVTDDIRKHEKKVTNLWGKLIVKTSDDHIWRYME